MSWDNGKKTGRSAKKCKQLAVHSDEVRDVSAENQVLEDKYNALLQELLDLRDQNQSNEDEMERITNENSQLKSVIESLSSGKETCENCDAKK